MTLPTEIGQKIRKHIQHCSCTFHSRMDGIWSDLTNLIWVKLFNYTPYDVHSTTSRTSLTEPQVTMRLLNGAQSTPVTLSTCSRSLSNSDHRTSEPIHPYTCTSLLFGDNASSENKSFWWKYMAYKLTLLLQITLMLDLIIWWITKWLVLYLWRS